MFKTDSFYSIARCFFLKGSMSKKLLGKWALKKNGSNQTSLRCVRDPLESTTQGSDQSRRHLWCYHKINRTGIWRFWDWNTKKISKGYWKSIVSLRVVYFNTRTRIFIIRTSRTHANLLIEALSKIHQIKQYAVDIRVIHVGGEDIKVVPDHQGRSNNVNATP